MFNLRVFEDVVDQEFSIHTVYWEAFPHEGVTSLHSANHEPAPRTTRGKRESARAREKDKNTSQWQESIRPCWEVKSYGGSDLFRSSIYEFESMTQTMFFFFWFNIPENGSARINYEIWCCDH